jgi:hypothetical protein
MPKYSSWFFAFVSDGDEGTKLLISQGFDLPRRSDDRRALSDDYQSAEKAQKDLRFFW